MKWEAFLAVTLAVLGSLLRLRQYLFNRSLWLDEANFANAVVGKSLQSLITTPLTTDQSAPVGFLVLTRAATAILGEADWALRFIPFLAGCALLFIALPVRKAVSDRWFPRLAFIGCLAFSPVLIYYASEFKPYSMDVCVSMAILWLFAGTDRARMGLPTIAGITAAGALLLWCSFPAVFLLAGVGTWMFLEALGRKDWRKAAAWAGVGAIWAANLGAEYYLTAQFGIHNDFLQTFWHDSFLPWQAGIEAVAKWIVKSLLGMIYLAFQTETVPSQYVDLGWTGAVNILLGIGCFAGAAWTAVRRRRWTGFFLLTLCFAFLAAAVCAYPFRSRLILYMLPIVFFLGASAFDAFGSVPVPWIPKMGVAGACLLIGVMFARTVPRAITPENRLDIRAVLGYVRDQSRPGDRVVLGGWTGTVYKFYRISEGVDAIPTVGVLTSGSTIDDLRNGLCGKANIRRIWVIFGENEKDQTGFIQALEKVLIRLRMFGVNGSKAILYKFNKEAFCASQSPHE